MFKTARYFYRPSRRASFWVVYDSEEGKMVADYPTREEARKETYRLNGWDEKNIRK